MSERWLWERVLRPFLAPKGFARKVQDANSRGMPDVVYCIEWKSKRNGAWCQADGWLELKHADWPARDTTHIIFDFEVEQRAWLRGWSEHGGNAMALVGLGTRDDGGWLLVTHEAEYIEAGMAREILDGTYEPPEAMQDWLRAWGQWDELIKIFE